MALFAEFAVLLVQVSFAGFLGYGAWLSIGEYLAGRNQGAPASAGKLRSLRELLAQ